MDITTATPVQIDTELARIYTENVRAETRLDREIEAVHYAVSDKRAYRGWTLSHDEAAAKARQIADTDTTYVGKRAARAIESVDSARAAIAALHEQAAPLNAEYDRRGGWTRAFLVQNTGGHVHRSMSCSTCHPTTRFAWMVDYSGADEAQIVADAGQRACTVCYPSAPVEVLARPTRMFGPDEIQARQEREEREQAKAKRQADKIAKGLTVDGSEFVVSYVEPNAPGWERDAQGRQVHVTRPRERRESFKTERSAVMWVVEQRAWGYEVGNMTPAFQAVYEAVAAKHGKTVEQVRAEIDKKVAAKIRRDS